MSKKIKYFLNGWASIYDLNPAIDNPYMDENGQIKSTEQSLDEQWQAVGGYLQNAMSNFDDEKTQQNKANI